MLRRDSPLSLESFVFGFKSLFYQYRQCHILRRQISTSPPEHSLQPQTSLNDTLSPSSVIRRGRGPPPLNDLEWSMRKSKACTNDYISTTLPPQAQRVPKQIQQVPPLPHFTRENVFRKFVTRAPCRHWYVNKHHSHLSALLF